MKKTLVLLVPALMLLACAPFTRITQTPTADAVVPNSIPSAVPPAPILTDTPAAGPFASFNLEGQIVVAGDLPDTYAGGQYEYAYENVSNKIPKPDYFILQRLYQTGGGDGGNVSVFLYEDIRSVTVAFSQIITDQYISGSIDSGVGEISMLGSTRAMTVEFTTLIFTRCYAVALIHLNGPEVNTDITTAYGRALDGRLQAAACRP